MSAEGARLREAAAESLRQKDRADILLCVCIFSFEPLKVFSGFFIF